MQGSISFDGTLAGSIAGGGGGGSNVTITPTLLEGTKVADYSIDDTNGSLYAPTPTVYTAGDNVTIDDGVISAADTTYTAGDNITIEDGVISATATTYTAGNNITIEDGVISATDTTYTAGTGISITDGVISATGEIQAQPIYFNFTKYIFDINHFLFPISTTKRLVNNTLTFTSINDYFEVSKYLLTKNMTYEIEIGSMNISDTTRHNTLFRYQNIGSTQNAGLIYRYQTLKWAVWDSTNGWQDSDISDKDYFANSTLKVKILSDGKWEIYKDDVLVFTPAVAPVFEGTDSFGLGSPSGACITNITINGFKIYPSIS